jgi:hypothetical protein
LNALRAFLSDVGSDALAKWSGGGGILFALAALVFPSVFAGLRPFLLLGLLCLFVSCFRAWLVAYSRTLPRLEVVNDHPTRVFRNHVLRSETHRIVVRNIGIEPVDDVHVFLEAYGESVCMVDLVANSEGLGELRLYHDVPRVFSLFEYEFDEGSLHEGRLHMRGRGDDLDREYPCPARPLAIVLAIVGKGVATTRYSATVEAVPEGVSVSLAERI